MPDKLTRRDFIKKSAIGVAAGSAAISGINITNLFADTSKKAYAAISRTGDDIIVNLADEKNKALSTVGGSMNVNDETILIRSSQTQFMALSLICTHKGCTVEKDGSKFVCPCHGSEYTLDGKVTQGPSKTDLKTYETSYDEAKNTVTVMMSGKTEMKKRKSSQTAQRLKINKSFNILLN
jgi:cytochrome b6-f complex iron-sulfur subunit